MHDEIEPLSPLNYKPTAHAQAVTKSKVTMQKKDALKNKNNNNANNSNEIDD